MHGGERTILLHAGLDPHFDGMASAVIQKDFFARAGNLDRSTGAARQFAGADFVREWVALPAKAAADMGGDDANMRARQGQYLAHLAMDIVWGLRRGPEGEFAAHRVGGIRLPTGYARVLFHRRVIVPLVVKPVFT